MVEIVGTDPMVMKQVTCRQCASILRYTQSEVRSYKTSCMGETCMVYYIDCPNGHQCNVNSFLRNL